MSIQHLCPFLYHIVLSSCLYLEIEHKHLEVKLCVYLCTLRGQSDTWHVMGTISYWMDGSMGGWVDGQMARQMHGGRTDKPFPHKPSSFLMPQLLLIL